MEAPRDQNHVPTALGVSNADNTTTLPFKVDSSTGRLLVDMAGGGSGNVSNFGASTDRAIAIFSGTVGQTIQNSVVIVGATGNLTGLGTLNALVLPASNFVGLTDTQTLTGKTINGASNTLTVRLASDVTGNLPVTNLNSGTAASSTTFWRGDGTWATPAGGGTVTAVSVATANGFAGTSSGGATPALTLTTTVTGLLKGNATAISAAVVGTDYSVGTSALATGILKSTTTTGALTIAIAADFPTLNQSTTGNAATATTATTATTAGNVTGVVAPANGGTGVANNAASTLTISGAFATTITVTAATGITLPTSGTIYGTATGSITSLQLATSLSDETGTGSAVFGTSPTITTPTINQVNASANTSVQINAGFYSPVQSYAPAGAGTATLDFSKGNYHRITMPTGNITIAFSNTTNGQPVIIDIIQDATGSRTVTWPTIKWAGGAAPTLTTAASKIDTLGILVTTAGSVYQGYVVGQNI